ncbi:MAG: pyruvate formate lyase-activating protein [Ruminococcaceae bacterium]|nr:pyruvate formate lyase-activating protein [Oscillospiraceae bacterium]
MNTIKLHSFQSLGTVDGPGVRAVLFLQGCSLSCVCCHNPDTWNMADGEEITIPALMHKIRRCRPYFGKNGGVTASGGEPLLQAQALTELFKSLKQEGIHTALDTSGCVLTPTVKELLRYTDLVLLDYKYTNDIDYLKYTGMEKAAVDRFLSYLNAETKETWLRHVYIPGLNDNEESIARLCEIKKANPCVSHIELLPFRKLCLEKYHAMGLHFPLENTPEPSLQEIASLKEKFTELS